MNVSKQVVGAAVGAFVVLIAIIAFLLGRESTRREHRIADAPVAPQAAPLAQSQAEAESPTPVAPATPAPVPTPPPVVASPAPVDPLAPRPAPPASTPPTTRSANATAIHDYFIRMDSIQAAGMGDTEEVAGKLLTGAMRGDSSGLDQIVASVDSAVIKVKAISPPPECTSYHAKMLDLLAQSQQLVRSLKSAMSSQDTNAIASIAMTGDAIKTKTEALEAEGKAIRSRAGL